MKNFTSQTFSQAFGILSLLALVGASAAPSALAEETPPAQTSSSEQNAPSNPELEQARADRRKERGDVKQAREKLKADRKQFGKGSEQVKADREQLKKERQEFRAAREKVKEERREARKAKK